MIPSGTSRPAPQRSCLGCGEVFEKKSLLRFVASPGGELLPDLKQKLPGRGAYVCRDLLCLKQAVKKKGFVRTLKISALPPLAELQQGVALHLLSRVESLIGVARKAGHVCGGSNLVMQSLERGGELALVICSEDISEGIGEKVRRKAANAGVPCEQLLTKARLGALVGRDERSVMAFARGGLAKEILQELRTYSKIVGEH